MLEITRQHAEETKHADEMKKVFFLFPLALSLTNAVLCTISGMSGSLSFFGMFIVKSEFSELSHIVEWSDKLKLVLMRIRLSCVTI